MRFGTSMPRNPTMSPNSFLKRKILLRESLKRKVLFAMLAFYSIVASVFIFGFGLYSWAVGKQGDELYRFSENYAFGKGINPFAVMLGECPQPEGIEISPRAGTAPYNFIFYYLFHFSDSDKAKALTVAFCFYISALIGSAIVLFKFVRQKTCGNALLALLLVLIFLGQYGVGVALGLGNYAIYSYFFILLLVYTNLFERRPVIGGLCMGLGMMKPQMMMLFFIPLLLERRFVTVFVSVALVVSAFIMACINLSMNPIELFRSFAEQGARATELSGVYCGTISSVGAFVSGEKPTDFLNISFVAFMALSFILSWKFGKMERMYVYLVPAAMSTVWSYSYAYNSTGIYILWAVPIVLDFFARREISVGRLALYVATLAVMAIYLPRKTLGLPSELFPFSEDIYRLFMVFVAFFIITRRGTFTTDYGKISDNGRKILQKV